MPQSKSAQNARIGALWLGLNPEHRLAEHRLLLLALDRHKAHVWTPHRLADRLGVIRIVLPPLAVGNHVLGGHELGGVAELAELTRPVVRAPARLNPDHTWRELREVLQHLRPCQPLANNHYPPALVHPVHLGDTITYRSQVSGLQPRGEERGLADLDFEIRNQHGRVCVAGVIKILLNTTPPG